MAALSGFHDAFERAGRMHPDARFVVHSDVRPENTTLADIFRRGEAVGAHFRKIGIGEGDVVAVMLPAWTEWLTALVGTAYAGAVFLPIVTIYKAKELAFVLRQSRVKAIITPDIFRGTDFVALLAECGDLPDLQHHYIVGDGASGADYSAIEQGEPGTAPVRVAPEAFAFLVYTSGTTADPKGVMHSGATLLAELDAQAEARDSVEGETYLSPWPPGHVAGALQLLRFIAHGTPVVAMDQWNAGDAARLVEAYAITGSSGTPFHMSGMLDAAAADGRDLSSLRDYVLGAAPVPASLVQRCVDLGISVVHAYGSSEHPTVTMGTAGDSLDARLKTEGRVMPGSEILIVDEDDKVLETGDGEIVTRGPELFLGYFDTQLNQTAFLTGGWYRTGDVGHVDADGYLHITDRKKDIIIRGGENISSREVEDAMRRMPGVVDAAAVAMPDERLGERVKVFVEMAHAGTPTLEDVRAHFAALGIAKQKTPKAVQAIAALPRNATGKVLKAELRVRTTGH